MGRLRADVKDSVVEIDGVPGGAQRNPLSSVLQPYIDVRGALGREEVQTPARHLEQRAADCPEVLGVAGEQGEARDRRLVRDTAGEEQIRVGIDSKVRIDVELVLARHVDQELLDATGQGERADVERLFHVPLEHMLREVPLILVPVGPLVPLEAELRIQHPVPVPAKVAPRSLVPDAGAQRAATPAEKNGPLPVEH